MDIADCEGGDGRCTAYGPTIRRGGAAGSALGSALDWGSPEVALIMGDFGLSAAAGTAAVSCFLYARDRRVRFRQAWLLFALSSTMASLGNLIWGWYEVVLGRDVPSPS